MTSSGHEKIASDVIANDQITHSKNSVWLMSENLLGRSKALFEESLNYEPCQRGLSSCQGYSPALTRAEVSKDFFCQMQCTARHFHESSVITLMLNGYVI